MTGGRLFWPELEAGEVSEGWLPDPPKVDSWQVLKAIARRHPMDGWNNEPGRWVFAEEVPAATGQYGDVQRFDAVAVGLVPSVRYARVIYEVKVSRSDWLHELKPIPDVRRILTFGGRVVERREASSVGRRVAKALAAGGEDDPLRYRDYRVVGEYRKWDAALEVSTEFWIAAPPKVVQVDELPPEAGLIEVRPWGKEGELRPRVIRPAPVRETPNPGPEFWASILRRAARRRS